MGSIEQSKHNYLYHHFKSTDVYHDEGKTANLLPRSIHHIYHDLSWLKTAFVLFTAVSQVTEKTVWHMREA